MLDFILDFLEMILEYEKVPKMIQTLCVCILGIILMFAKCEK